MGLQGQGARRDAGYAMAAMLVALGIMSVVMMVALPAWRQMVQREKEEELIFRGQQYARSIGLFQRKYAAAYPPDIDTLVQQKFLRKKYKDPMVPDGEFLVLYQASLGQPLGAAQPGRASPLGGTGPRGQTGQQGGAGASRDQRPQAAQPSPGGRSPFGVMAGRTGTVGPRGGVIGVASKSTEKSIRLYNGRDRYSEWQFVYSPSLFGPGQRRPGMRPGQPRPGSRPGRMPAAPGLGRPGATGSQPSSRQVPSNPGR